MNANSETLSNTTALLNFGRESRLPIVLQTEASECGLACIAMIAGFYGYDTDLINLRNKFSVSNHGLNLKGLMSIATKVHLAPRALKAETVGLENVTLPCILHWSLNHFIVLKSITKNSYFIHDPAYGERSLTPTEFNKYFTGVLLELTPTHEFIKVDERKTLKISDFWSRSLGIKRSLTQIIILSLLLQIFALASPFYMQIVVDDVLLRKDHNLLIILAFAFTLLMLIQLGTNALREFVILHVSVRLGMQMSTNLFRHLIRLPIDYFSKRHMGDVISRFGSVGSIRNMLTNGLVAAVVDGVMASLTLTAMLIYSPKLTLFVIVIVVIYAGLRWLMYAPFRLLNEEAIVSAAKESSYFMESIRAIQTIKIFQKENYRQFLWQNKLVDVINKNIKISKWGIFYSSLNGLLFGIENVLIIYMAASAVMDSIMSLGMLYAFLAYKGRFIGSVDSLIGQWIEFKMINIHLNRLADIAHTKAEDIDSHVVNEEEPETAFGKPANKLENNDFSQDLSDWRLDEHDSAKANPVIGFIDGRYGVDINIINPGEKNWSVQLIQANISLIKGETYKISFWAKNDTPCQLLLSVGLDKDPWTTLEQAEFSISQEWELFHFSFSSAYSGQDSRLEFSGFGNKSGHMCISEPTYFQINKNNSEKLHSTPQKLKGDIEVINLSFRYAEHEPYAFKNVNFKIHAGESVAITGPSGCGKTTLLKCLMGLIKPTEGEILIDGIPLENIPHYRSQISSVMQEDQLLSGDILENIGCFSPTINTGIVKKYSRMACIHDEIEKMPMQYHTLVGDMGSSLSGGQKQRIVLARALYRNPTMLFMDEATSHLDVNNETEISSNIKALNITRVLVAHRPETVASADRQIKLDS